MPSVRIVVDGPREFQTVPKLIERILGIPMNVVEKAVTWREIPIHKATGRTGVGRLGRKLLTAVAQARCNGAEGLVATIDLDKGDSPRLEQLRRARAFDREGNVPFPTALGEAVPHFEAWLLDDPVAVRQGLRLATNADVPTVAKTRSPKDALNSLMTDGADSERSTISTLASIAEHLVPERCIHAEHTGFAAFRQDLLDEFRCFRGA